MNVDWSRTALLLVDPQVDVLGTNGGLWDLLGDQVRSRNVIPTLVSLRSAAEEAGVPVLYSWLQLSDEDYATATPRNPLQALMAERRLMSPGTGARFIPELEPRSDTVLLTPRTGPSPAHTDWVDQIQELGVDTVVIGGMIANLCVEEHVRDGTQRGLNVVVIEDAIATMDSETHAATLRTFGLLATAVIDSKTVIETMTDPCR